MFEIVHTAEGWVVRDEQTGRTLSEPARSMLDASCDKAELELAWKSASPHARSAMLLRFA